MHNKLLAEINFERRIYFPPNQRVEKPTFLDKYGPMIGAALCSLSTIFIIGGCGLMFVYVYAQEVLR